MVRIPSAQEPKEAPARTRLAVLVDSNATTRRFPQRVSVHARRIGSLQPGAEPFLHGSALYKPTCLNVASGALKLFFEQDSFFVCHFSIIRGYEL